LDEAANREVLPWVADLLSGDEPGEILLMHDRGEDAVLRGDVERVRLGNVGGVHPLPRAPSFDLRPAEPH
jgi:hypothetical protein